MTTLTNANGDLVDLTTGEVMGRAQGAPTTVADPRKNTGAPDQIVANPLMGLLQNTTWGFNSALFALPDALVTQIGKQIFRQKPEETVTLTKLFNSGEVAPRNVEERYARAAGEGLGGTLPFTGVLAAAARMRPMVMAATPSAGIIKSIANDAIQMVQKSPMKAAALDMVFGVGYEGLRQAVEENVSDENQYKPLLKELLPAATFVGLPLAAATLSPTALAVRGGKQLQDKLVNNLGEVGQDVLAQETGLFKLPGIRIVPSILIGRAEKKLSGVFADIQKNPEALKALDELNTILANPDVEKLGFQFGVAERYMDPALLQKQAETLQGMSPKDLAPFRKQYAENQAKLEQLFSTFSPDSRKTVEEAFRAAQQQRQTLFDDLLSQRQTLTDSEKALLSQRLGPQNPDQLNNELRGVLMAGMEMDAGMRQGILKRMGLKQAMAPDGTPMPTRVDGKSLFPARDMEAAATALIEKYKPERPSMRVSTPEPVQLLERFVKGQQQARDAMTDKMLVQLTDQAINEQLGPLAKDMPADFQKALRDSVLQLVRGDTAKGSKRKVTLADIAATPDKEGMITVATGIPGRKIYVNPGQLQQDAQRIAAANTGIDINVPEALDYLQSAQRFRNDSLGRYNAAMMKGRTRLTDAQRIIDSGNSVFKDVEKLIMDHVPKIKQEYQGMKMILDDYKAGYEQSLPLLMTQKTRGGQEYYLPNEDLMATAFKNADRLRQLQITIGNNPQGKELLEKGAVDWIRSKPIFNNDGLIDATKLRRVIDQNKNIVEALPASVRLKIEDEAKFADDIATRLAEIDQRRIQAKDAELDNLLAKSSRADASPRQTLEKAIKDPATMRSLVNEMSKDPENLASLRRSVYDLATEGAAKGGALEVFLRNNEKSLKVLYGGTGHYDNLLQLASMQRRVNAFADVTGQVPAFDTLDQQLQSLFGVSIPYLTTSIRNVAMRNVSKETMLVTLGTRLLNAKEAKVFERMFTKALEDPKFAEKMTNLNTPAAAASVAKELQNFGMSPRRLAEVLTAPAASRGAVLEAQDLAQQGNPPIPVSSNVSRGTSAAQMLKAQPTAPATRGTNFNPRMPTTPQVTPGQQQIPLMYPAMFPNDPISGLLQQRQAQVQPRPPGM
jgi:hypothetical protein